MIYIDSRLFIHTFYTAYIEGNTPTPNKGKQMQDFLQILMSGALYTFLAAIPVVIIVLMFWMLVIQRDMASLSKELEKILTEESV